MSTAWIVALIVLGVVVLTGVGLLIYLIVDFVRWWSLARRC